MMFQDEYKKAYDEIKAEDGSISEILIRAKEKSGHKKKKIQWKPVVIGFFAVVTLFWGVSIPAIAKEHAERLNLYESGIIDYTSYKSMQRNSYSLDVVIPENASVSKDGVIVTLEAAVFDKTDFVLYYSLANEEGYDLIQEDEAGEYNWDNVTVSFDGKTLDINQTRFWKYDKEKEKAYYKFESYRDTARYPEGETISLEIKGGYKINRSEETVDLSNVVLEADTRVATIYASNINKNMNKDFVKLENDEYPYTASVLDITPLSEIPTDRAVITGIAYIDGVLRVQSCQPDNSVYENSYHRAFVVAYDKNGNGINSDEQISWYEKNDGKVVLFVENYYLMSENQWEEISMKLESMSVKNGFNTVWEVEFVVPR